MGPQTGRTIGSTHTDHDVYNLINGTTDAFTKECQKLTNTCNTCEGDGCYNRVVVRRGTCTTCNGTGQQQNVETPSDPTIFDFNPEEINALQDRIQEENAHTIDLKKEHSAAYELLKNIKFYATDEPLQALGTYVETFRVSTSRYDEMLKSKLQDKDIFLFDINMKAMRDLTDFFEMYEKQDATSYKKKLEEKLAILRTVHAAAITRNETARGNKSKARKQANDDQIKYKHRLTDAQWKDNASKREMNKLAILLGEPRVKNPYAARDKEFKAFRPDNLFTGFWSGNSYECRERLRLGFSSSCPSLAPYECKNTGNMPCDTAECTIGANTWHSWHTCTKPCTACVSKDEPVYLREKVGDHPLWTECQLMAIEGKSINRCPYATIKIGDETHTIYSTNLSTYADKPHKVHLIRTGVLPPNWTPCPQCNGNPQKLAAYRPLEYQWCKEDGLCEGKRWVPPPKQKPLRRTQSARLDRSRYSRSIVRRANSEPLVPTHSRQRSGSRRSSPSFNSSDTNFNSSDFTVSADQRQL